MVLAIDSVIRANRHSTIIKATVFREGASFSGVFFLNDTFLIPTYLEHGGVTSIQLSEDEVFQVLQAIAAE